jgi:hypothetical protein
MIDTDDRASLKVPKEIALKLDKKARAMGLQTRAPWATLANMVLAQAVKGAE